jgi:hypothetical protein
MPRALRYNGLSIVLVSGFLLFWVGQSIAGNREFNADQAEHGQPAVAYPAYLRSSHFWEATTENWESELGQPNPSGSPESKPVDAPHRETGGG